MNAVRERALRLARLTPILICLLLIGGGAVLAQCAMCEGNAAAGADGGAAYNRSTLFMLAIPYLLLGGIGGYVVYAFRRPRTAPAASDPVSLSPPMLPGASTKGTCNVPDNRT